MLITEATIGHFVLVGLGWITLTVLKDIGLSSYKSWKFSKVNHLNVGDRAIIDKVETTVGGITPHGLTFIYDDKTTRFVSTEKVFQLDIRKMH